MRSKVKWFRIGAIGLALLAMGAFLYLDRSSGGLIGFSAKRSLLGNGGSPSRVEINGINLYYETYSADRIGDPILILHGDFAYVETMHHQIRALSRSHFVIAPESRAHGRSTDVKNMALSYSLMADDMVALLDTLNIEKVSIFGWSGGGNVGMDMAIRHPDRVKRLVTYGSNFSTDGVDENLLQELTPDNPNLDFFRSFYKRVSPDPDQWPIFVGKMKTMWQTHPTLRADDLAEIAAPTLIMAGEFDLVPHSHTEEMAKSIPNAKLVIIEGEDHFAPLMAPKKVNPHVTDFLE